MIDANVEMKTGHVEPDTLQTDYPGILGSIKLIINVFFIFFLTQGRASLTSEKQRFAHEHGEMKNLEDIVKDIKPSVLIGNFFYFKAMTLFFIGKKWGCGFV